MAKTKKRVSVMLNPALMGRTVEVDGRFPKQGERIEMAEGDDRLGMRVRNRGQLMKVFVPFEAGSFSGHPPNRRGRSGDLTLGASGGGGHQMNRRGTSEPQQERQYDEPQPDEGLTSREESDNDS